ncbi:hypothetical protein GGX14DRAFT_636537 [Mycena pura]|uniref:Uncharacterized protein n=1 Tax=Mycena pura TaxID=153505 RepID=A0AAD6VAM1_9AGAR|nr:hypothetical protein GGX14DRAFT_636537 [Mycena pura]
MHFSPSRYPDPFTFSSAESANLADPYKRMYGVAICIGMLLADKELFLAISMMLWYFDMAEIPGEIIDLKEYDGFPGRSPLPFRISITSCHEGIAEFLNEESGCHGIIGSVFGHTSTVVQLRESSGSEFARRPQACHAIKVFAAALLRPEEASKACTAISVGRGRANRGRVRNKEDAQMHVGISMHLDGPTPPSPRRPCRSRAPSSPSPSMIGRALSARGATQVLLTPPRRERRAPSACSASLPGSGKRRRGALSAGYETGAGDDRSCLSYLIEAHDVRLELWASLRLAEGHFEAGAGITSCMLHSAGEGAGGGAKGTRATTRSGRMLDGKG